MIIYKIINDINNKIYVGKTCNFLRRYHEHFRKTNIKEEPNKKLYLDMHKYGFEHFTMSIIEECDDSIWEAREQYWIDFYKSMIPNGYNMIPGGMEPPHLLGENSSHAILTQSEADQIIELLSEYDPQELSNKDIAEMFNISVDQIKRINLGQCWRKEGINYPIRYYNSAPDLEKIYELLESWEYTCEEIGRMFGKTKSCIKAINNGQNFYDKNRVYPIKPPKIFYSKKQFIQAKKMILSGASDSEITRETGIKRRTLINLKNGYYDKYLNL